MLGGLKTLAAHIANTVPPGRVVTRRRRPYEKDNQGSGEAVFLLSLIFIYGGAKLRDRQGGAPGGILHVAYLYEAAYILHHGIHCRVSETFTISAILL